MVSSNLAINISFPFCYRRCTYCTKTVCKYDPKVVKAYSKALITEIESMAEEFEDYTVDSIYLSGSPCLMEPSDLNRVLVKVRESFNLNKNVFIAVKTRPGEYSRAILDKLRDNGVNHYIVSLMTANESLHQFLGRPYDIDKISMADMAIKNFNMRDLGFELMYNIPGQSERDFDNDLNRILSYKPEHISLYSFNGKINKCERLTELGYIQYTDNDYCLKGHENKYIVHIKEGKEYLGIGYRSKSHIDGVSYVTGKSLDFYLSNPVSFDNMTDIKKS